MEPRPSGTSSAVGAVGTLQPYTCRGERLGVLPAGTDGVMGMGHCPAPTTAHANGLMHARREAGEAQGAQAG